MKRCLSFIIFLISLSANAGTDETAVLSIGRSMEWSVPAGTPITVASGAIVRVVDLKSRVKVVGQKIGETEVRAGQRRLHVHVVSESERRLHHALDEAIAKMRGLELGIDGKLIHLSGRLLRFEDWKKLAAVAQESGETDYNSTYHLQAAIAPELAGRASQHFKELLRAAHLPDVVFELQPSATVTIPPEPKDLKARVARVLGPYGFKIETSESSLSLEPMVRMKLVVAEVRKSMSRKFGIQWPTSFAAQLLPTAQLGDGSPFNLSVQFIEDNGIGKVLASPTLLCRSGKEAKFLAGGEIPIRVVNFKVQDIIWKQYGVVLKFKPRADFSGRMSIDIETEVSSVDPARSVDGVPGFLTNRIESHFDLSASRTIVLSGLIKNDWSQQTSGLPVLSTLPVLGPLFGSPEFKDSRTELVVFVTPELARPDEEVL